MKTNEVSMYEGDNSYDVVMFIKCEKIYHQVNISTIYLDARASHHSSITDQPWKDCKEFADQLYKEIKSNKQLTRDIFYKYNQKYVDYKDNNGDYYGLSKGDNQKDIEQWIYDNKRKEEDMTILKTANAL